MASEGLTGRRPESDPRTGFWQEKSPEQLAAEQGVRPVERFEDVWGRHAGLWGSDEEFQSFLKGVYDRRRRGATDCRLDPEEAE